MILNKQLSNVLVSVLSKLSLDRFAVQNVETIEGCVFILFVCFIFASRATRINRGLN